MLLRTIVRPLLAASVIVALVGAGLVDARPPLTMTGPASRISDAVEGLQPAARVDPPPARPSAPGVEAAVAALNRVRADAGAPPLRLSISLSDEALGWSTEMSRSGFRHSGGPYGENVAMTSDVGLRPDAAAELFNQMWVRSPGHYANMTNPAYREVGIGLYLTPGGWWATHVFR